MRQKPVITINTIELLGSPRKEESTSITSNDMAIAQGAVAKPIANANF